MCLSTLGPGATNLVTPAAYAQLGAMPMLMITGQKPIKSSKQGRFQVLDVVDMMQSLTKYTTQVVSGDRIPSAVREAFRLALEERPGAVHIELPEDIAAEDTDAQPIVPSSSRRPIAEYKAISAAVDMLEQASSPLLLIGAGANRKLTAKMLREFVDKTGIPFVTTQMGKGVLDEHDDKFMGNAALSDHDFVHRAGTARAASVRAPRPAAHHWARRGGKTPVFHAARGQAQGHARQFRLRGRRPGLLSAARGDRRYRQQYLANQGADQAAATLAV